jgi:hypothetical protein
VEVRTLQRIHDAFGDIFVFESHRFDFPICRVYFTTNVPVNEIRGHHAHKTLEQILVCPNGAIEITLDDGKGTTESVCLDSPDMGLFVGPSTWRTMKWLKPNSLLLVFASKPYEESDYIREYREFCSFVRSRKENF